MATLADSFLADFESSGEEESEAEENENEGDEPVFEEPVFEDNEDIDDVNDIDDIDDIDETGGGDDIDDIDKIADKEAVTGMNAITNLLTDNNLTNHIEKIDHLLGLNDIDETKSYEDQEMPQQKALQDTHVEYDLIVKSNELAGVIDNEIATIHKFVRDVYATKLQELEQLVPNALDYAACVKIIGNETDISLVEADLLSVIPQTVILTISVTATTTTGKPLPEDELARAIDGCDAIIALETHKSKIYDFVESRMSLIAPNTSTLIGPEIAARLMAIAGGLKELSKIPSCNLQVLGARRTQLAGFSRTSQAFHTGLLGSTQLMMSVPSDLRQKCLKVLAGRCTLCLRADSFKENKDGALGEKFYKEIVKKIAKWQEPPPAKKKKALVAPLGEQKKKRGGKRKRAEKAKYEVTDLQKAKQRMHFGKAETVDEYTGESYGTIGQGASSGRLTMKKKDTQKLKNHLSRKMQARLKRVKSADAASGMASSIAFTPVQGMHLVQAPEKKKAFKANNSYFGGGGFLKVGK